MYEVCIHRYGEARQWVRVAGSKQAADVVRQWADREAVGGADWGEQAGDVRRADTRQLVARVSPNGRVWNRGIYPLSREIRF